jgi:hypothetical protein
VRKRAFLIVPAAAIVVLAFVPLPSSSFGLWVAVGDAAHFPLMAGLTFLLLLLLASHDRDVRPPYRLVGTVGCATAIGIELVQPMFGRTASVRDALVGCFGVAAAIGCVFVSAVGRSSVLRAFYGVAVLALSVTLLIPVGLEWRATEWRRSNFPVLAGFEDEIELRLWRPLSDGTDAAPRVALSRKYSTAGERSLEVRTNANGNPTLLYVIGGQDWRRFHALTWSVYNPGESFHLTIRIDDAAEPADFGSRFYRGMTVERGTNRFELTIEEIRRGPRDRALDLSRVERLMLFVRQGPSRRFFLDDVRLLRSRTTSGSNSSDLHRSATTGESGGESAPGSIENIGTP